MEIIPKSVLDYSLEITVVAYFMKTGYNLTDGNFAFSNKMTIIKEELTYGNKTDYDWRFIKIRCS